MLCAQACRTDRRDARLTVLGYITAEEVVTLQSPHNSVVSCLFAGVARHEVYVVAGKAC